MSSFLERLAVRMAPARNGVRPYVPSRFAPEAMPDEEAVAGAPAPHEAASADTAAYRSAVEPQPEIEVAAPWAKAPVIARYASSLPPPAAAAPPAPAPDPAEAPAGIAARSELLVPSEASAAAGSAAPPPAGASREDVPQTLERAPLAAPIVIEPRGPSAAPESAGARFAAARSAPGPGRTLVPVQRPAPALGEDLAPPPMGRAEPPEAPVPPPAPALRAAASPARPTVHVTIGRVDVRAVLPMPGSRPPPPPAPRASISLEEYLRQRDRGER